MCVSSNLPINMLANGGAEIVPIAHLLTCKLFLSLKIKLFKVKIRLMRVTMTFVAILLFCFLLRVSSSACSPSSLGMLVYRAIYRTQ